MSTTDLNRYGEYCDKHKQLIVAHIHSHPGFGAFYSMPDSETLRTLFYADHNVGIVVDNLQNQYMGFKMYGNQKQEEPIYWFDLQESVECGHLNSSLLTNVSGNSNFKVHKVVNFSNLIKKDSKQTEEVSDEPSLPQEKNKTSTLEMLPKENSITEETQTEKSQELSEIQENIAILCNDIKDIKNSLDNVNTTLDQTIKKKEEALISINDKNNDIGSLILETFNKIPSWLSIKKVIYIFFFLLFGVILNFIISVIMFVTIFENNNESPKLHNTITHQTIDNK